MARQQMYPAPWRKHMEAYSDFGGGLNTVTSNDNLRPDECPDLTNIDLGSRGSLKRRYGMVEHLAGTQGLGQGYFRYYKSGGDYEEIEAIGGRLYRDGEELPIEDLDSFQNTRVIEAVQYHDKMYIATGTKFVEYDGDVAKIVEPYKPTPLEALYIGTNGLAENPDEFLDDGVGSVLKLTGLIVDKRYGVINSPSLFTAYVSKPANMEIEYKFIYRNTPVDEWEVGTEWVTEKAWEFTPLAIGDYEIQVLVRDKANTEKEFPYVLPRYTVKEIDDNEYIPHDTMHECNRILLYWDRIILYGDPTQPLALFISHIKNMAYFPIPHSLEMSNVRQEPLNRIVVYRDSLLAFANSSVQAIFGKHPAEFVRITQHASIGCIAPESIVVVENSVYFRSNEGIHALRSVSVSENRADIRRIDANIENIVPLDSDACGAVFDNQYHLLFPQRGLRLRYYYTQKRTPWSKDESERLDFSRFYRYDNDLFGQSVETGTTYRFDESATDDAGTPFTDFIKLKSFDFGEPYNPKKLKQLQLLIEKQEVPVKTLVRVYADSALVLNPDESHASVDDEGNVVWNTIFEPNMVIPANTILGVWELGASEFGTIDSVLKKLSLFGKCRRVTLTLEHLGSEHNRFLGCAFVFKTKKP